jgi:hypothetical protein
MSGDKGHTPGEDKHNALQMKEGNKIVDRQNVRHGPRVIGYSSLCLSQSAPTAKGDGEHLP